MRDDLKPFQVSAIVPLESLPHNNSTCLVETWTRPIIQHYYMTEQSPYLKPNYYDNYQAAEVLIRAAQDEIQEQLLGVSDMIASAPDQLPHKQLLSDVVSAASQWLAQPLFNKDPEHALQEFRAALDKALKSNGLPSH